MKFGQIMKEEDQIFQPPIYNNDVQSQFSILPKSVIDVYRNKLLGNDKTMI